MYRVEIYIQGERLDLFSDENISVVSSVQKIEDISRVFNDFSKSFTVPASPNNNRIFKHWYNFSINNGFDARIRHEAHIDIQSTNFRQGTIRLESCKKKNNKPTHYKLTFFGRLIDLKNLIGADYLSSLDLSIYNVDYTPANVRAGLTSGLFGGDYIFPLISTQRQWFYNSNIASTVYEERLANIAWNGSAVDHGMEWTSFRPAISINKIIEAIELKYGISFSRDFLETEPFDGLYLWLANQDSAESIKTKYRVVEYDDVFVFQPGIGSYNNSNGAYTPTKSGSPKIQTAIVVTRSVDGVLCTVQLMNGENVVAEKSGNGDIDFTHSFSGVAENSSIYLRVITSSPKTIGSLNMRLHEYSEDTVLFIDKFNFTVQGAEARIQEFVPKLKTIDFLKSIIKMYNLVVVPDGDDSFYIDTLDEWYKKGKTYDISKYVDTEEENIGRSNIYSEITFTFEDPETILAEQFKKTNNTAYGDLSTKLKSADGTPLDGGSFGIEVDFEQMVYEKLLNLNNDNNTNIVYGLSLDGGRDEAVPEAHIFYAILKDVSANPISFVDDTGSKAIVSGNVFMPSHADADIPKYSTCFGGEVNEHTGAINNKSLYQLYYRDYITDSFSTKRRKIDREAKFPLWLLGALKLNDRVVIDGDRYIINEMTVNVTTQIVDLELLNDIYGEGDLVAEEETATNPTEDGNQPIKLADSFSISSIGGTSSAQGCSQSVNDTKYWNGTESEPTLGDKVYDSANMSQLFNGVNRYYKIAGTNVIRISPNGVVMDKLICSNNGGGNQ